jgi:transcriptional regulator with XRE-family HTH domain
MGRRVRPRALRLNEKLFQIRKAYGLSQSEIINRLGLADELTQSDISAFEREPDDRWSREPALPHLLCYARLARVSLEILVDPALDLPDRLAPDPQHGVVDRTAKKGKKPARKPGKFNKR